jgi:dihydroneopterin aldolase
VTDPARAAATSPRLDAAALALRDSITLTGLRVRAHHGVFDFERENGQDFVIDATVWLDLAPAASGDALAETVHYGELAIALADAVTRDPVDLIETVAERLAAVALSFAAAEVVRITVHKPDAPIPLPFDDVAVQITRLRP